MNDGELLTKYVGGDQGAFRELVGRYVDMVHAAARRQAVEEAEDVVQAVFILLARKAGGLKGRESVAGWLLTATRLCAGRARRSDMRRRFYEREAGMRAGNVDSAEERGEVLAMLDGALEAMPPGERELVIGRHLRGKALEAMAAELGVTVPTATKRVQRALERLRGIFARRGKSVGMPMLAAVLAGEAAHRAPAALAGRVPSDAARGIADAVWRMLRVGVLKMVGAVVLMLLTAAVVGGVVSRRGGAFQAAVGPGHGPSVAVTRSGAGAEVGPSIGNPVLASFNIVMDEATAERLRAVGKREAIKSERYDSYRAATEDVMGLLREAMGSGALPAADEPNVSFSSGRSATTPDPALWHTGEYTLFHGRRAGTAFWVSSAMGASGTAFAEGNGMTLDANLREVDVNAWTQTSNGEPWKGSVQFKGTIASGETMFFLAGAGSPVGEKLVHGIFWQVFKAMPEEIGEVRNIRTSAAWIPRGPSGALALADRALVWRQLKQGNSGGTTLPRGDAIRKLSDGGEVRVVAMGRPEEYPFCWWKADGTPAEKDWTGFDVTLSAARAVVVAFSTPEFAKMDWSVSPCFGIHDASRYYTAARGESVWEVEAPLGALKVGVSWGAWKDLGTMKGPGEFEKGEVSVSISRIVPIMEGKGTGPAVQFRAPLEVDLRLLAVDKAGMRHDWLTENLGELKGASGETVGIMVNPEAGRWQKLDPNFELPPEQIDHFVVQTRKREWVTFEDLPEMPLVEIPERVSAEAVAGVRERMAAETKGNGAGRGGGR